MPISRKALSLLYGTLKLVQEDYVLENEPDSVGSGLRAGVLTEFIIMKNGKPIEPLWEDCTDGFLEGVEAYGLMAYPCENWNWRIWTGQWQVWPDLPFELVHIPVVTSFSKESDVRLCNGNEVHLWLYGRERCFGLMSPAIPYVEAWESTLSSWVTEEDPNPPGYSPVRVEFGPPHWWRKTGGRIGDTQGTKRVWQIVQKEILDYKRAEEQQEEAGDDVSDRAGSTRKGKGRAKPEKRRSKSTGSLRAQSSSNIHPVRSEKRRASLAPPRLPPPSEPSDASPHKGRKKRKRGSVQARLRRLISESDLDGEYEEPETSAVEAKRLKRGSLGASRRSPIVLRGDPETEEEEESEPDGRFNRMTLGHDGGAVGGSDVATSPVAEGAREADVQTESPVGTAATETVAGSSSSGVPVNEPSEAKQRAQKESESRYSPGPSTQAANALPPLGEVAQTAPISMNEVQFMDEEFGPTFPFTQVDRNNLLSQIPTLQSAPNPEPRDRMDGIARDRPVDPPVSAPTEIPSAPNASLDPGAPDLAAGPTIGPKDHARAETSTAGPCSAHVEVQGTSAPNPAASSPRASSPALEDDPLMTGARSSLAHRER
ncbi:hypothetical protein RhiJN_06038 [Ceratobasidium sp. AG-Ba]|nr:hypothetical protein RhiJN_06038 [Ceratobasidium sp. AG-Ba]